MSGQEAMCLTGWPVDIPPLGGGCSIYIPSSFKKMAILLLSILFSIMNKKFSL
jgi:hypothetical protein